MKTTIELPDKLLTEAKNVAKKRRTSLKSMIEHALRRELFHESLRDAKHIWEFDEDGFPVVTPANKKPISNEDVYAFLDEE